MSQNFIYNNWKPNHGEFPVLTTETFNNPAGRYIPPQVEYRPLQGYISTTQEANPEVAEELNKLYDKKESIADKLKAQGVKGKRPSIFDFSKSSNWDWKAKALPITGDIWDTFRGRYRMTHGQPLGGALQMGLGIAGLGTLGIGSIGKSLAKGAIKSQLRSGGKGAISVGKALGNRVDRDLLKNYINWSKGSKLANNIIQYPWLRWPVRLQGGFFGIGEPEDNKQLNNEQPKSELDNNSFSTLYDNPDYNPYQEMEDKYFGELPYDLSSFELDTSTYPSLLGDNNGLNEYGLPDTKQPEITQDNLIDVLRDLGYTDGAIQDALNGNDNGVDEIRDGIIAYNSMVGDDKKIPLKDRPIIEDSENDTVPFEALTGNVQEDVEPEEDTNNLEYLNALVDIEDAIANENEEYRPYIENLANYLKDYDDKYKFYHDMKRYYAAMSGLSGNSGYNYVPNGLDPRSSDLAKLELYSKLADKKIELDNRARQLKGNVDLAKSLGYPLSSAFADKNLLNAYTNAKLADSRIKATQAIAELNRQNQLKIAEMNNRRAIDVARLNNISAMDRVKLQQNESNYRKSLDIREKELDRKLKAAQKIGDWSEARKLEIMKQSNSNKRTAVTALSNYVTYGQDPNMSIYDIASILGEDINAIVSGIAKRQGNNSLAKEFEDAEK